MAAAEDLKSSVRKDVQVRVLPPLPGPLVQRPADLKPDQFPAYSYPLGIYLGDGSIHLPHAEDLSPPRLVAPASAAWRADVVRLDALFSDDRAIDILATN